MLGRGLLYSNSKFDPSQHYITYSPHPVKCFNATCINLLIVRPHLPL